MSETPPSQPVVLQPDPADRAALVAARDRAVTVDLAPLSVLEFSGPDAAHFLHNQLSSDVKGMTRQGCQYTSYNSPKGRVLANFILWRSGDEAFSALVPADIAAPLARRLKMYVLRSKVAITDRSADLARLGIGGPAATFVVADAIDVSMAPFSIQAVDDATIVGLPGPRYIIVGNPESIDRLRPRLAAIAPLAGYPVWQWLTVRAGVPLVTAVTQELFVAQMLNWDVLGGVNFQKGCYPGQEIVARTRYLGRLKERAFVFHADAADVPVGARLYSAVFGDQPCGTVVGAAPAPDGGTDVIAVVQVSALQSGDVRLDAADGTQLVALPLPYALPEAGQTAPG